MQPSPASTSAPAIQLCAGEVRHRRLRPVQNAFHYGVFYLRVPVRSLLGGSGNGNGAGAAAPALRWFSLNRFNLLSFHDADHGDCAGGVPLHAWIEAQLERHGAHDADGEIWLQTMPRVLGYLFNPVSFWFCHGADGSLRAVLCDVRNTFGERHLYMLRTGAAIANGATLCADKAFHVSPFLPLRGGYRFRFVRALREGQGERHLACIDYSDDGELTLSTSISGTAQPLSDSAVLRACLAHPLLTLGVMARIHWQALRLWCKRAPFFSKPPAPSEEPSK
jgi:DUF1365 family protein